MALLHVLSYAAVVAAFAFVTLSLASGLLYVSELIEEHSRLAKVVGQRAVYAIIVLHVLLYFSDALPFLHILFSIVCHAVYLQNFSSTWPLISLTSPAFLASCVLVISDHFLWFFYFARVSQEARHTAHRSYNAPPVSAHGFAEITTFFGVCVWLAPLFLFLSLSANDNALPVASAEPSTPTSASMHIPPPRVSLFGSLLSTVLTSVPRIRPRRRDEGLIAPPTPQIPPPSPLPPPSPSFLGSPRMPPRGGTFSPPPPPRSPGPAFARLAPEGKFTLGSPPVRHVARRATADGVGLGLRRATAPDDSLFSGS